MNDDYDIIRLELLDKVRDPGTGKGVSVIQTHDSAPLPVDWREHGIVIWGANPVFVPHGRFIAYLQPKPPTASPGATGLLPVAQALEDVGEALAASESPEPAVPKAPVRRRKRTKK